VKTPERGTNNVVQRLTVSVVDQFIADLKDCVREAKAKPSETGQMVTVYGTH
jgi:sphinganine-1-phosphate aldolase